MDNYQGSNLLLIEHDNEQHQRATLRSVEEFQTLQLKSQYLTVPFADMPNLRVSDTNLTQKSNQLCIVILPTGAKRLCNIFYVDWLIIGRVFNRDYPKKVLKSHHAITQEENTGYRCREQIHKLTELNLLIHSSIVALTVFDAVF